MQQTRFWFALNGTLAMMVAIVVALAVTWPIGAVASSQYKVLHRFTGTDGANPYAGLIFDASGSLYGTTAIGGKNNEGSVFKLTQSSAGTWTESVLYSFAGPPDGENPYSSLIFDADGNLYGTTANGGQYGKGTVFRLTPTRHGTWKESVLHSFVGSPDGLDPAAAGLVFDAAGNLYGTTAFGGSTSNCGSLGCGVVFSLTPNSDGGWTENVLYNFCPATGCPDEASPWAGVIFDTSGNLYGTTSIGGQSEGGVAFELARPKGVWTESVLYSFCSLKDCTDGAGPYAGLSFDPSGNLYGTTMNGGSPTCLSGGICGVVFELTPNSKGSWRESVLHTFQGHPAAGPNASVILDKAGNLYGTTANEVVYVGEGTVFKLTPQSSHWNYRVLHLFRSEPTLNPYGNLLIDNAGNLYGTATSCACGKDRNGVVFQIRHGLIR
jgi:uncharacterized repeat protein (TIGR03803 family)